MVSQSEIGVVKANGKSASSKNASGASKETAKARSSKRNAKGPTGTDIVPVMKLKAIDIVGNDNDIKNGNSPMPNESNVEMPPFLHTRTAQSGEGDAVQAGENAVSDPELLDLLQQLSETIDTANTVLEGAASDAEPAAASPYQNGTGSNGSAINPTMNPDSSGGGGGDAPPFAARAAELQASLNKHLQREKSSEFGLVAKAGLAGLVLAAGASWILYTNPWLLDRSGDGTAQSAVNVSSIPAALPRNQAGNSGPAPLPQKKPDRAVSTTQAPPMVPSQRTNTAAIAPPSKNPAPAPSSRTNERAPAKTFNKVADPVLTSPGQSVALDVGVDVGSGTLETSVMVQGVPVDARLSAGKSLGSGNWLLRADQLVGLRLVTGNSTPQGMHGMDFIVVRNDGSVPETQTVDIIVGEPTPAPGSTARQRPNVATAVPVRETTIARRTPGAKPLPAPQPAPVPQKNEAPVAAPAPLSSAETTALLARSTALLDSGDVAGARLLLEYAAQRGSKDAMVKLAQSYDPEYLSKLPVLGVKPNKELAAQWYDRAAKMGR